MEINTILKQKLRQLNGKGLLRTLVSVKPVEQGRLDVAGKTLINLSSNDYLGLAANRKMIERFYQQAHPDNLLDHFGPGAAASRLMTGNTPLYERLEKKLASLYGRESCLVFNSGYHGNAGILPALAGRDDLILADKLCHASIIDGMRLSSAARKRFPHLDYEQLEQILAAERNKYNQVFLVSESIFSMDGDAADLERLTRLKKKYRCFLYLDEAHAVGVFGNKGLGLAEQYGVIRDIDLLFGTFGKALAGVGGFALCSRTVADYLVNTARTLLFTTGLPPVCLHWLLFVLEQLPAMKDERQRLLNLADSLRQSFTSKQIPVRGNSQIIPVIIGASSKAMAVAEQLRDRGYWVTAVRPPTVPSGSARIRLSCSSALSENDLQPLPEIIAGLLD